LPVSHTMLPTGIVCLLIILSSIAEARVTFTYSEVLQASDLLPSNKASFKCDNGCKVYTDNHSNLLMIMEGDNIIVKY
ncbi:hypothetical protein PFISCL1PPCAC_22527, partial [Pristionchus fissidentatus]